MKPEPPLAEIIIATVDDLAGIATLAALIWRASYPGIISRDQIEYMLPRMYDLGEMQRQLAGGTVFIRLVVGDRLIGFAAHSPTNSRSERKLDKLYLHPDFQRQGYGSRLLDCVMEAARALDCRTLMLTVNKRNPKAIAAYEKNGFIIREAVVAEIGGGFVMDDYVMVRAL